MSTHSPPLRIPKQRSAPMTTTEPAPRRKRTPLAWAIVVVTTVIGSYLLVTAFEGYDPKAAVCVQTALASVTQGIPSSCRFPVWSVLIALLLIGGGISVANTMSRRS